MINSISTPQRNVIQGDISGTARPQNVEQAAEQFEALFLRTMLQQMRKASDALVSEDNPFNSKKQRMMRDLHDDTLASHLASQRSSGITDLLIAQLSPQNKTAV